MSLTLKKEPIVRVFFEIILKSTEGMEVDKIDLNLEVNFLLRGPKKGREMYLISLGTVGTGKGGLYRRERNLFTLGLLCRKTIINKICFLGTPFQYESL